MEKGIPFLVISNVSDGSIHFENTRFVSEGYYNALSEYRKAKPGDLARSGIDYSSIIVRSFLEALPSWQKKLLRDLLENGLSKSAAARKYKISVYRLEKILVQLWVDYQSGNWEDS